MSPPVILWLAVMFYTLTWRDECSPQKDTSFPVRHNNCKCKETIKHWCTSLVSPWFNNSFPFIYPRKMTFKKIRQTRYFRWVKKKSQRFSFFIRRRMRKKAAVTSKALFVHLVCNLFICSLNQRHFGSLLLLPVLHEFVDLFSCGKKKKKPWGFISTGTR